MIFSNKNMWQLSEWQGSYHWSYDAAVGVGSVDIDYVIITGICYLSGGCLFSADFTEGMNNIVVKSPVQYRSVPRMY